MNKKIYLTALALSMTVFSGWSGLKASPVMEVSSVMKALPIYSNTLIDKAPEGEVVTGVRDCYSAYFQSGDLHREFVNGVVGQYVEGNDGNIYLRAACYSAAQISPQTDTYLKLEKVDDNTYVAHTPQLIWVDSLNEGTPFTAYATRVVFSQKSATSFGYEVQQNPDGTYDTDIYFTLENGALRQQNRNTTEMNEEVFPEELIGFTNSAGGWLGFGDGCISIYTPEEQPTALPENAELTDRSLDYNLLHVRDVVLDNAVLVKSAEVGDDFYISNPSAGTAQWIKGSIDRDKGTVTFEPQYLGTDTEKGNAVWFIPVTYDKYINVFDEETGYGDWFRTYARAEKMTFNYDNGTLTPVDEATALYFSRSSDELLETGVYADPVIIGYKDASLTPANVTFTKYEDYDDLWGFGVVGFAIPCMDAEGYYINPDELYYNIYPDDSTEPFVFSPKDYIDMQVPAMTDVPYAYFEDFDFKVNGVNHTVYFYHDWKKVGVQVVQKHDGTETRSGIVYSDGSTGIKEIAGARDENVGVSRKFIRNGEIVIVRNGVRFDAFGRIIK